MVTIIGVAIGALLLCIGTLLGAIGTSRILQSRLRRRANKQAEERRLLAKEWEAIRRQQSRCPHCNSPLTEPDRHSTPAIVKD
jgi:uncharacterized protein with PIN domain